MRSRIGSVQTVAAGVVASSEGTIPAVEVKVSGERRESVRAWLCAFERISMNQIWGYSSMISIIFQKENGNLE